MASKVDLHIFVAPVFATNTCILVTPDGSALIVDPGAGVADAVIGQVKKNGWQVKGVAATHGHADHTWDGGQLCAHFGVPFLINEADRYRLDDPIGTLQLKDARPDQSVAVAIAHAVRASGIGEYQKPADIQTFGPNHALEIIDALGLELVFAPGHTEGSTLYVAPEFVLSGDVLFAGSIGRTDLPGGDLGTMNQSLRRLAGELAPELTLVPGHGPTSTVAQELATNPYWKAALVS
jgi:hydroxyacylglutathione hydrolase